MYEMNRNIKAIVDTPHGRTEEFEIEEAVRQGTIFGPTLCGVSTNRINKMGLPDPLILYESIEIECPIFLDDMSGMGTAKRIENVGMKMAGMEVTKKFQFNNDQDKTEYMVMKNNKKEEEKVVITVRKGEIGRTKEYKCLGDNYKETGSNESKIRKKMEKAKFMAHEVRRRGAYTAVGYANMSVQLLLLDMTVKPTLLANTETWCNITSAEEAMITSHHHEVLCILFGQPRSTPYWGILGETGIWPYKYVIIYKKLMFLHHIINSDEDRIARRMAERQEEMMDENRNGTWYSELWHQVHPMGIATSTEQLREVSKSVWKKEIKKKLGIQIAKEYYEEAQKKTKLRFLRNKQFQMEEYVDVCDAETVARIMKIRLNMVECKMNFKGKYEDTQCLVCDQQETTEHLLQCEYYKQFTGPHAEVVGKMDKGSKNWLEKAARVMDIIQEIREQHEEF